MNNFKHILSALLLIVFVFLAFGSSDTTCTSCMDVQYADNLDDVKDAYEDSFEEIQEILESLCESFISRDKTWQEISTDFGFLKASLIDILDNYPYNNFNLHPEEQQEAIKYGLEKLKSYPDLFDWYNGDPGETPCVSKSGPAKPISNWQKR